MGDSMRLNPDFNCDFFWSASTYVSANGTWDRTFKNNEYVKIINIGEVETTYIYDFFDNYKTVRLNLEDSNEFIYYSKQ